MTPISEDAGLFKTALCELMLELIPQTRRSDRNDFIVRGFVDRKNEIDVWFAGRRAREVGPLEHQLKAMLNHARKQETAVPGYTVDIEKLRLPVRALGAWRRSRFRDDSGWETGTYHFVMARWSLLDRDGKTVCFGETPQVYRPQNHTTGKVTGAR